MGVCQTKVKKNSEAPKNTINNKIERVKTEFSAT